MLLLLLGAATTVAVAWTLALVDLNAPGVVGKVHRISDDGLDSAYAAVVRREAPGRVLVSTSASVQAPGDLLTISFVTAGINEVRFNGPASALVEPWARSAVVPCLVGGAWPAPGVAIEREAEALGWPFLALWCSFGNVPGGAMDVSGAVILPGHTVAKGWRVSQAYPAALPYRPIWTGLLVDSFVFASAWWVGLTLLGRARRTARRHRGRCAACGYDLAGNVTGTCPECGKAVGP